MLTRLLLKFAAWLHHRQEKRIARLERTDPARAETARLLEELRAAKAERRILRARLRRIEAQERATPPDED